LPIEGWLADRRMTKSGPQYSMQKTKKWATQTQPKTRGVLRYFQRQAVPVLLVEPLDCLDSGLLLTSKLLTLGFMRITLLSSIGKYLALKSWIGRPIRNVYLINDCHDLFSFLSLHLRHLLDIDCYIEQRNECHKWSMKCLASVFARCLMEVNVS